MKFYPCIVYPDRSSVNQNLINFPNTNKGFSENYFEFQLSKYFKNIIQKDVAISDGRENPYQPDFVLSIPDKQIFIDIEVDEPYSHITREPIHIDDSKRDSFFSSNGWGVIRFSEEQVVKVPFLCCKVICEYLYYMTGDSVWMDGMYEKDNLEMVRAWCAKEALSMEKQKYRESYSGIVNRITTRLSLIKPSIHIIADGIFLTKQIDEIKGILKDEESISAYNEKIKASKFMEVLLPYLGNFKNVDKKQSDKKTYIDFTIYISTHHGLSNFEFDADFIEFEDYIINIYYIKTDKLVCFEVMDKIDIEGLKCILLIADDPSYSSYLRQKINLGLEIILMRDSYNTHMPTEIKYLTTDRVIEPSLEIKYFE